MVPCCVLAAGWGMTAWGARSNEYLDLWDAMTEAAVGPEAMHDATAKALPWEELAGATGDASAARLSGKPGSWKSRSI